MNERSEYAAGREERMREMAATTSKIVSADRVHLFEGDDQGSERRIIYNKVEDLKSGKEYFEEARIELGYEKNLLRNGGYPYRDHALRFDNLSRQIAVMSGQAKEIAQGVIQYKTPHVYYVGDEKHTAVVGDRWNAEICKQAYVRTFISARQAAQGIER